jgi:pyruvate dehydrogenase complex dehydrogenase (E1) component
MNECVDGEYQAFKAKGGAYVRKEFFGRYPETAALVEDHDRRADRQPASRRARPAQGL